MTGKNDAVNESLSALLDGEHTELDLRRVLKTAESDESVSETWASYQLTRQVIRKDLKLKCSSDFLAGIQDAIADESAPALKKSANDSVWRHYSGKVAIAACFTFVFLIGVNQWSNQASDATAPNVVAAPQTQTHEPMAVVPAGFELPPLTARTVSSVPAAPVRSQSAPASVVGQSAAYARSQQQATLSPAEQALLEQLMHKHAEASAANGGMSVIPLIRANAVDGASER